VLFGPPGSGKGTQSEFLRGRYRIPQIATGELMRAEARAGTELGQKMKSFMDQGRLVPDDITIEMFQKRLLQPDTDNGFLLDGFPRTVPQADNLEQLLKSMGRKLDHVIYIRVPLDLLVQRISGRLTCPTCGHTYHPIFNRPRVEGRCDLDGGELFQRDDDSPETGRARISDYMKETLPVLAFYRLQGCVSNVDGEGSIEEVSMRIVTIIEQGPA
jgi:adenylate kinase